MWGLCSGSHQAGLGLRSPLRLRVLTHVVLVRIHLLPAVDSWQLARSRPGGKRGSGFPVCLFKSMPLIRSGPLRSLLL